MSATSGETHFFPYPLPSNSTIKLQAIVSFYLKATSSFFCSTKPLSLPLSSSQQPVPGTSAPGHTPTYVSANFPHLPNPDTEARFPKTAYESFNLGLKYAATKPCLGKREVDPLTGDFKKEYSWETYESVDKRRTEIGSGLLKLVEQGVLGEVEKTGWSVGIWSGNRPEWQWVNQGTSF